MFAGFSRCILFVALLTLTCTAYPTATAKARDAQTVEILALPVLCLCQPPVDVLSVEVLPSPRAPRMRVLTSWDKPEGSSTGCAARARPRAACVHLPRRGRPASTDDGDS